MEHAGKHGSYQLKIGFPDSCSYLFEAHFWCKVSDSSRMLPRGKAKAGIDWSLEDVFDHKPGGGVAYASPQIRGIQVQVEGMILKQRHYNLCVSNHQGIGDP